MSVRATKAIEMVQSKGYDLPIETIRNYIELAKKEKNAELAYELACLVDVLSPKDKRDLELAVIRAKDPKFSYLFARDIPGAHIRNHEQVIMDAKDLFYVCEFACDVFGARIEKLQQLIFDSKDPKYAYLFAYYVDRASVKKLETIVVESQDPTYIRKFMYDIENSNKKILSLALGRISKSAKSRSFSDGLSR